MGHRANFVIIRNGNARAFHDQYAALGCTFEFAEGPSHATRSAETHDPTDELLDWAFAEAGYLIDHDKKLAIVFGYPEIDPDAFELEGISEEEIESGRATEDALMKGAEAFLKHISAQWRGWELNWDDRGVDSFATYLRSRSIDSIAVQPEQARRGREVFRIQA